MFQPDLSFQDSNVPSFVIKGIALAFAKAGASGLVLAARNVQNLEETKAGILKINSKAKVVVVSVDTTSQEAVSVLEQAVKDAFGHVDILVNNAGVGGRGLIKDIDVNKWWSDMVRFSFPRPTRRR